MQLTEAQVRDFTCYGVVLVPGLFKPDEIALLRARQNAIAAQDRPENLREPHSGALRSGLSGAIPL